MKLFILLFLALFAGAASAEPVSAGIAIYGMYAGAAGAAALVAGNVVASTVLAGMMFAGGALSLAGQITGNKTLSKYGGLISLAGGIGNIAVGAKEVAGQAVLEEGGGAQLGAGGAEGAGPAAAGATATAPGAEVSAVNPGGAVETTGLTADTVAPNTQQPQGLVDGAAAAPAPEVPAPGAAEAANGGLDLGQATSGPAAPETAATASSADMGMPANQNPLRVQESNAGIIGANNEAAPKGVADYLRMGTDFITKNKEIANVGGKIVQGAFDAKAKQAAQQSVWDEENRKRAQYNQSVAGSTVPYGVNPKVNVNNVAPQNPVRYAPQRPGG